MKKQFDGKKTHWLRNTLCVLIACGILGLLLWRSLKNVPQIRDMK